MKSFSIKALALAFVIVSGSAQGMFSDEEVKAFTSVEGNAFTNNSGQTGSMFEEKDVDPVAAKPVVVDPVAAKPSFLSNLDAKLFGKLKIELNQCLMDDNFGQEIGSHVKGGFRPFSTLHPYCRNGYARAAVVTVAGAAVLAGITAAVVKTYKHFTKPAADATEEAEENAEANEANAAK